MKIFPAIDLYEGKAVRLYKGDYDNMTVYSDNPLEIAGEFEACGAEWIHVVDLEGARDGNTPNFNVIKSIAEETSLKIETGGGIRSMEVIDRYLTGGISRVILGTATVTNPELMKEAVNRYGSGIAAGADVKDGMIAIKGWVEKSDISLDDFLAGLEELGVDTVICTDISRDGAMKGTNLGMYSRLAETHKINLIASGGVSSMDDVRALAEMDLYGAIIGKAYYTGAIDLKEAIKVAGK